jgi:small subunit ribosomal protein S17
MSGEAPSSSTRGPKQITGIVTSAKMQKTRAVQVVRLERHEKYGKFVRRHTTFKVHDEKEVSREGDTVLIVETRPISKTKRWRLIEVIEKSRYGGALAVPGAEDSAARAAEAAAGAASAAEATAGSASAAEEAAGSASTAEEAPARASEEETASSRPAGGEEGGAP